MTIRLLRAALLGLSLMVVAGLSERAVCAQQLRPATTGETIYVPVYSEFSYGNLSGGEPSRMPLSVMLSLRNVDLNTAITIASVDYYDSAGMLLHAYLAQPVALSPLATTEVFVEHKDMRGGTGAKFIVVWHAAQPVDPPVVQALHAYFFGNRSAVFVTEGQPIHPKQN